LTAPLDQDLNPRGSEDFFSSDIPAAALSRTFGALPKRTPLLILYSGQDQFVPEFVDKEKLVERWVEACEAGGITVAKGSGVVKGANHQLAQASDDVLGDVLGRVEMFLKTVEGGDAGKECIT
jgi:alpha-beta hydrolase superfamily lysophospholipase